MGELRSAGDVADREDAAVGGAQPGVDFDALGAIVDAGGSRSRPATLGGGRRRRADASRRSARPPSASRSAAATPASAGSTRGDRRAARAWRCRRDEALAQHRRQFGIVLRQDAAPSSTVTSAPSAAMGLRHLDADRAAADDDQMTRQLGRCSKTVSLVKIGHVARGRGSAARPAVDPVARTKRRARMRDRRRRQCRAGRRSGPARLDHLDAEPARTARPNRSARWRRSRRGHGRWTAAKSTLAARGSTPKRRLAARMRARRPSPRRAAPSTARSRSSGSRRPCARVSISTVAAPSWAAPAATDSPPEPAPMTQMSALMMDSVMRNAPGWRPAGGGTA